MNSDYLNNYSKTDLEAYITHLNELKATYGDKYQPNYMTVKNNLNMETLDARARLGTVETKEALDELEDRIAALEVAASNIGSGSDTPTIVPTKRLVSAGKQLVRTSASAYVCWVREPVGDGNLYAVSTGTGFGLSVSRDGGKTFNYVSSSDVTFNGLDESIDTDYLERIFRYCDIEKVGNEFLFITCFGTEAFIFKSEDLRTFDRVSTPISLSTYSFILLNGNDVIIIDNNNKHALKYVNNTVELLGDISYEFDPSYSYRENRYKIFKNKIYFKNYKTHSVCTLSEDYLSATPVTFNNSLGLLAAFQIDIQNNILIVSDQQHALFTTDGEDWQMVGHPYADDYFSATLCEGGMMILYNEADGLYYSRMGMGGSNNIDGIYCWENLAEVPTLISDPEDKMKFRSQDGKDYMRKANNKIYFILNREVYTINNRKIEKVFDLSNSAADFFETAFIGYSSGRQSLVVSDINGYRTFTCPSGGYSYVDQEVYTLENYNASGDETDVISVVF